MNKKRKKLEIRYIILIVTVIFIILVAILSYSLKTNKQLSTFESIVKDVVVEIQKITYMPVKNFNNVRFIVLSEIEVYICRPFFRIIASRKYLCKDMVI